MKVAIISLSGSNSQHNCVNSLLKCLLDDGCHIDFYLTSQYQDDFCIANLKFKIIQPQSHPFILSLFRTYFKNQGQWKYDLTIFLDNASLILFPLIKTISKKIIYIQLELTDRRYCYKFIDKFYKFLEIYSIPKVNFVITQDLWRAAYCAGEFRVPLKNFLIFPNSPIHVIESYDKSYIRKEYGIANDVKIVGYIGMIDQYTIPDWLVDQMKAETNIQYFFHTHKKSHPHFLKILSKLKKIGIVSTNFMPSQNLTLLYSGLDIGLAIGDYSGLLNKYTTINQDLSGYSYGKINWYLSLGKPIIYSNKVSLSYIKDYQCGLELNPENCLGSVIDSIIDDYSNYSVNCFNYFKRNLSFEAAYAINRKFFY